MSNIPPIESDASPGVPAPVAAWWVRPWAMFPGLRVYVDDVNGGWRASRGGVGARVATVISVDPVDRGADGQPLPGGRPAYMVYTDVGLVGFQAPNRTFGLAPMPGRDRPATFAEFAEAYQAYHAGLPDRR